VTEIPRTLFRKLGPASAAGAAAFVIGCVLAATLNGGFLALAALGALGPTLLRQAGFLDDQDEFQKQAAAAAATHAFVATVVVATAVLVARAWQGPLGRDPEASPWLILFGVVLATRFASYAWRFWDARQAAQRILLAFGTLWLLFVVLSHGTEPTALAVEGLVVAAPFFALAALARRFSRAVGAILVALAIGGAFFFHVFTPRPGRSGPAFVVLFLLLPVALTGIGLLGVRPGRDEEP
jgi:hypothetical protein